ncbi:hypothetical protein Vadar_022251 [Vaccinium darrowii]|uniref:Uncharacterized protein n=1 Tax=Vaccinium darrowii TaxID=229202 RepID=A0ACB7X3H6_9ERIC|nr:hypothetical protein Vadar_022251 [Vaccinium darrowii]
MVESFQDGANQVWGEWEIRSLILLSLLLQIVLIIFGNWRKHSCSTWVGVVIWAAYLLSESVATFSLGLIATATLKNSSASADKYTQVSEAVRVFWAPFLLVHLGGPDTITAYSLEDNELWLRHLFVLLVQVGIVFYLLVLSWIHSSMLLTIIAIPVFVSGILKYGEKIWVLWSSSSERFIETLLAARAGPDYIELVAENPRTMKEGQSGSSSNMMEPSRRMNEEEEHSVSYEIPTDVIPEAELLFTADRLFKILKSLYANLILDTQDCTAGLLLLPHTSPEDAFKVIEIELGFMYDLLFSKASVARSPTGLILRSISLVSSSAAFLAFCTVVDKHNFSLEDTIITYVLVVGAICTEIYGIVMLIFSERTLLHLKKQHRGVGNLLYRHISASPLSSMNRERWSGSMSQYNLIGFCIDDKSAKCMGLQKFFQMYEALQIGSYKTWKIVTTDLKEMIMDNIKERCGSINRVEQFQAVLSSRGDYALEKGIGKGKLGWTVHRIELDHSILIWHIATDLCYYSDLNANPTPSLKAGMSKSLSDYMLYLLVLRPFMLPKGTWGTRYRDMCAEVKKFISQRKLRYVIASREQACLSLLEVDINTAFPSRKGNQNVSALYQGCFLADQLKALGRRKDKWNMITEVWIEMLCYVANKCEWKFHIQELSRGGELLTHVRLLMVHLGLSDQFHIPPATFGGRNYFPS